MYSRMIALVVVTISVLTSFTIMIIYMPPSKTAYTTRADCTHAQVLHDREVKKLEARIAELEK